MLHCEESLRIARDRQRLVTAPHMTLPLLQREDQRLVAHLDGVVIACQSGWVVPWADLGPGSDFLRGYLAVAVGRSRTLAADLAARAGVHDSHFVNALEWVSASDLQGVVPALLTSSTPAAWKQAIAICAMHQVNPGRVLGLALKSDEAGVRSEALRAIGHLGDQTMMPACIEALSDEDEGCRAHASLSAVLLGNRGAAVAELARIAAHAGPHSETALALFLRVSSVEDGHRFLADVVKPAGDQRALIAGAGILGDAKYIPWLLESMKVPATARLAAEAFTNITGLDLFMGYDTSRPQGVETGPTDDPADEDVALDPDEDLPWPDVRKVESWWARSGASFQPGTCLFLGKPVTEALCAHVLRAGYQRQRIVAAQFARVLNPGAPLFNTGAPAWRQQRLLAQMG